MPRVPQLRQDSVIRGGSVGRMNIDAPVEAFGGGNRGLASLGQGLQSIGAGMQRIGEKQKNIELDKKESAAKEAAARAKILSDAADKRLLAAYDMQRQDDSAQLKQLMGVNGGAVVGNYDGMTEKRIEQALKDVTDPVRREQLMTKMIESDVARRNTLYTHQNEQILRAAKDDHAYSKESLKSKMANNFESLASFGDNVAEWGRQFSKDVLEASASGEALGDDAKTTFKEIMDDGSRRTINNLIKGIAASELPDGEAKRVENIINQFTNLEDGERADFIEKANKRAEITIKQIEDRAVKLKQETMSNFADTIANIDNDNDREDVFQQFIAENPGLTAEAKTTMNGMKKPTPFAVEQEWTDRLMNERDLDKYKTELRNAFAEGKVGIDVYKGLVDKIPARIEARKKTVFNGITSRLEKIKAGLDETMKKLPGDVGMFSKDVAITDKLIEDWRNLREMTLDPNVTPQEIDQIAEQVFFKPEAFVASKNAEARLVWAGFKFAEAAEESGTQQLRKKDAAPFNPYRRLEDEEVREQMRLLMEETK